MNENIIEKTIEELLKENELLKIECKLWKIKQWLSEKPSTTEQLKSDLEILKAKSLKKLFKRWGDYEYGSLLYYNQTLILNILETESFGSVMNVLIKLIEEKTLEQESEQEEDDS